MGLLGTVTGLLQAFTAVNAQGGYVNASDLSSGLYNALLTSAGGLVVAIPAYLAHSYLCSRVNLLIDEMERGGTEIVHLIQEAKSTQLASGSIIPFAAPTSVPAAPANPTLQVGKRTDRIS